MLSHTRIMFRRLRGIGSRGSRGSEPTPSAPATTSESETFNPHAIHISDVRRSPTKLPRKPGIKAQSVSIMVLMAILALQLFSNSLLETGQFGLGPNDSTR